MAGTATPLTRVAHVQTASWGRRVLALLVDWIACTLVVIAIIGVDGWSGDRLSSLYVMLVFILEATVLTALVGGSFGKLATRLRVVRWQGSGWIDLPRSLLRAVLVALVIPPLVFQPDGRGLHDLAAGSAAVPLDEVSAR